MLGKVLVPKSRPARRGDKLLDNGSAVILIMRQCRHQIGWLGLESLDKRQSVFQCEARSRADGEMRGPQRVADQHHVLERPAIVPDPCKIAPSRTIGNQSLALQRLFENKFTIAAGLLSRELVEAGAQPGGAIALDEKRAHRGGVAVVVGIEVARIGLDERLGQGLKVASRAIPYELVREIGEREAEITLKISTGE